MFDVRPIKGGPEIKVYDIAVDGDGVTIFLIWTPIKGWKWVSAIEYQPSNSVEMIHF